MVRDITPYAAPSTLVLTDGGPAGFDQFRPGDNSLNLQRYWQVLTKRKWQIAVFFAVVVLCVGIGTFFMTPVYTASATLLIEERSPAILDIRKVLSESLGTDAHDYYETQYEILRSRHLAIQIVAEQHLQDYPIFYDAEAETYSKEYRLAQLVEAYLEVLTQPKWKNIMLGWIGPKGTFTGFHFDYADGLLAQVCGQKFVRLVSPE